MASKQYEKIIYIAHPYKDDPRNAEKVDHIIITLMEKFPNYLFIHPIRACGWSYTLLEYYQGLEYCFGFLDLADELWVYGDYTTSTGCCEELKYCDINGIPYRIRPYEGEVY